MAKRPANEEMSLQILETYEGGAKAATAKTAKYGPPKLAKNQELAAKTKAATQFRAARALGWSREETLARTRWSLQWYMSIEKHVIDEDRRIWSETDSRNVFAAYREQQLQLSAELADLAQIFRGSKQFSALVAAMRTRSEILDKIVKTGQDLGVITRAAKKVEVSGEVDVSQLNVDELRVHISSQVEEISSLAGLSADPGGIAGAVMKQIVGRNTAGRGKAEERKLGAVRQQVDATVRKTSRRNGRVRVAKKEG